MIPDNKSHCMTHIEMDELIQMVVSAYEQGFLMSNDSTTDSTWDIDNAAFFSATVITTIGIAYIKIVNLFLLT